MKGKGWKEKRKKNKKTETSIVAITSVRSTESDISSQINRRRFQKNKYRPLLLT